MGAGTGAVEVEQGLEERRVVVEKRRDVGAALVPDAQQPPGVVAEVLEDEVGRRRGVSKADKTAALARGRARSTGRRGSRLGSTSNPLALDGPSTNIC